MVISATWHESTEAFSVLRATISITEAGPRPLFPADSKRLQYTKTQLKSKDGNVRKIILPRHFCKPTVVTILKFKFIITTDHFKFKFTECDIKSRILHRCSR